MTRLLIIWTLLISLSSCNTQPGENNSDDYVTDTVETTNSLISGPLDAQTGYLIHEMNVNNIAMKYCLNNQGDTVKIWTNDTSFRTADGYKIGTTWKEIPDKLKETVYKLPGWGYYVDLENNWSLCFCEGHTCTDSHPVGSSRVEWIEKRK